MAKNFSTPFDLKPRSSNRCALDLVQQLRGDQPGVGLAVADEGKHVDDRLPLALRVLGHDRVAELFAANPLELPQLFSVHRLLGHAQEGELLRRTVAEVEPGSLFLCLPQQAHTLVVMLLAELILGAAVELVVDIVVVALAAAEMETPHHLVVATDQSVHDLLDATLNHRALGLDLNLLEFHGRSPYYSAPRSSRASPTARSLPAGEAGAQVGAGQ
jgi:hypothetical protein